VDYGRRIPPIDIVSKIRREVKEKRDTKTKKEDGCVEADIDANSGGGFAPGLRAVVAIAANGRIWPDGQRLILLLTANGATADPGNGGAVPGFQA
jgi:hypothetical protein